MVELRMLHGGSKAVSRTRILNFQGAKFGLFKDLLRGIPWVRALEEKGVQESWSIFKNHFLQAQDQCIPMNKKSGKGGRRPAWISKEIPENLKWKKEIYGMWKKGQATWEDCRNIVRVCRDMTRKAKALLELRLAKDIKDNKKGFYKYISSKRNIRENVGLLLNKMGVLVMEDTEKTELLNAFFPSVFTEEDGPQESQTLEVREESWRKEDFPLVIKGWVTDQVRDVNTHKSKGSDGVHPRVLRELADVAKPLSTIFEKSWRTGEVPDDWRKANITPTFKKGKKEDLGNYQPISLTCIPGKVMEQIILKVIIKHAKEGHWEQCPSLNETRVFC
ncbi:hypothetical protein BTVI_112609 [Pitangus sulphuratus]|nr:hypothetical protein BTVI_112609 [Pitangus sulphuratus]